jgi:hypothetical protein
MAISGYAIVTSEPDERPGEAAATAALAGSQPLRVNTATSADSAPPTATISSTSPAPAGLRTFSAAYPLFVPSGAPYRVAETATRSRAPSHATPEIGTTAGKPPPRAVGGGAEFSLQSSGGRTQDPGQRRDLARSIQEELRRVGCYSDEIDGIWGPYTQRAMRLFTERVNASLPTDQPDYILLTLLQGQTEPACGSTCRSHEVMASNGTCQPRVIVAQQEHAPSRSATQHPASAVATASPWAVRVERRSSEPLPGRMAVGAPVNRSISASESPAADSAFSEQQIAAHLAEARRIQAETKRRERLAKAEEARQRLEEKRNQIQKAQIERQARLAQERRDRLAAAEAARTGATTPDAPSEGQPATRPAGVAANTKMAAQPSADAVASWGPISGLGAGRVGLPATGSQVAALAPPAGTNPDADTSDEPRFVQRFTPPPERSAERPHVSASRPARPVVRRQTVAYGGNRGTFKASFFLRLSRSAP